MKYRTAVLLGSAALVALYAVRNFDQEIVMPSALPTAVAVTEPASIAIVAAPAPPPQAQALRAEASVAQAGASGTNLAEPAHSTSDRAEPTAGTSLRGTQPDGELRVDTNGRLVLDASLVRVFDYWLALTGEIADAQIRARLLAQMQGTHGDAVAQQAIAIFDRYVAMRAELAAQPPIADLEQRFAHLRDTRRRWFGADAEAMFGAEEDYLAQTLARRRLADDPEALAAFDAARPAAQVAAERDATAALVADEQTRQLDAAHATPEQRREEREQLWGTDAAARLAALDVQRADWDRRVADYRRDRAGLDEAAAAALRGARFTPEERTRIEALETIGALGAQDE